MIPCSWSSRSIIYIVSCLIIALRAPIGITAVRRLPIATCMIMRSGAVAASTLERSLMISLGEISAPMIILRSHISRLSGSLPW
jgi:hypothetical protein